MTSAHARFLSIWNGIATIIFFAGVFLQYRLFSYSAIAVGIFMWVVGGAIAGILFGPKGKRESKTKRHQKETSDAGDTQFCIACGAKFPKTTSYCPECGTTAVQTESSDQTMKTKAQSVN